MRICIYANDVPNWHKRDHLISRRTSTVAQFRIPIESCEVSRRQNKALINAFLVCPKAVTGVFGWAFGFPRGDTSLPQTPALSFHGHKDTTIFWTMQGKCKKNVKLLGFGVFFRLWYQMEGVQKKQQLLQSTPSTHEANRRPCYAKQQHYTKLFGKYRIAMKW